MVVPPRQPDRLLVSAHLWAFAGLWGANRPLLGFCGVLGVWSAENALIWSIRAPEGAAAQKRVIHESALPESNDEALLAELGARLARLRLERNQTQAELAREAGVSLNTVRRLEDGASVQLANWIRVLRALDLVEGLDTAVPAELPRPLDLIERGRRRQRASGGGPAQKRPPKKGWTWGDEA